MDDARLIYSWVAFNSLYGIWDPIARKPKPERRSFWEFTTRVVDSDHQSLVESLLGDQRELVKLIVGDEYLSYHF